MDSLDTKQNEGTSEYWEGNVLVFMSVFNYQCFSIVCKWSAQSVFPRVYTLSRPALFLTPQMCFQVGLLMSDWSAEMLAITESSRPVWWNSSLGESKHIIQRSLMLERKEVLDDFCFCLDLGQCLPFIAGMSTGWFQMCFGRLIWTSWKSATVGPQDTLEQVIMLIHYQWMLMLNYETMKILLLHGQPRASQITCTVRTSAE